MKKILLIIVILITAIGARAGDTTHIRKPNFVIYNKISKVIVSADTGIVINNSQHYIIAGYPPINTCVQAATVTQLKALAKSLNLVATKKEFQYLIK